MSVRSPESLRIEFQAPGPVSQAFSASRAPIRAIMGPVGSGKTSVCLMDLLKTAQMQAPSPVDGVRYTRHVVIRDTYRNINRTVLKSWHQWVPKSIGNFTGGGQGEPAMHGLRFSAPGGVIDTEILFVALGDNQIEHVMRGIEFTSAYLNEADGLPDDALSWVYSRAGRYPPKIHGKASWSGVICDFNAPDVTNWTYDYFIENKPPAVEFYRQPSGFSPHAENLHNLPPGYYENIAKTQPAWFVRRMVENEFGYTRDGLPIFEEEFKDSLHVANDTLDPLPGLPVQIGMDAGLTPAAIFGQRKPNGAWRWLRELIPGRCGAKRFGERVNQMLFEEFNGLPVGRASADPSAAYGADREGGELDWIEIVSRETGLHVLPASTNNITVRLECIREPLRRLIDGAPGLVICPSMKLARKAFNSGYRYRQTIIAGQKIISDKPEKNEFSHPMDAGQYLMMEGGEYEVVQGRQAARNRIASGSFTARHDIAL